MSENDFEKHWVSKFSDCLGRTVGQDIRERVLPGDGKLPSSAGQTEIIEWTRKAMDRLDAFVDYEKRIRIMSGCACRYPESELDEIKNAYANTKDVGIVHKMLQDKFISFLRDSLKLSQKQTNEIISWGWGLAGVRQQNRIIATKIPKSGNLIEYMKEADPEKRRVLYCHCPRIREVISSKTKISPTYCYCGAGFYKAIWEYILQQPVKVELLESVLQGDDTCKIAIHLPPSK